MDSQPNAGRQRTNSSFLVLFWPSPSWRMLAHAGVCLPQPTNSYTNFFQKHLHRHTHHQGLTSHVGTQPS